MGGGACDEQRGRCRGQEAAPRVSHYNSNPESNKTWKGEGQQNLIFLGGRAGKQHLNCPNL